MKISINLLLIFTLSIAAYSNPNALQMSPKHLGSFPRGEFTQAESGDYLLRNDKIMAVIASPSNHPAMAGTILDLAFLNEEDRLAGFLPFQPDLNHPNLAIQQNGENGHASITAEWDAGKNHGLAAKTTYIIQKNWEGVWLVTSINNTSSHPKRITAAGRVKGNPQPRQKAGDIYFYGPKKLSQRGGFAWAYLARDGMDIPSQKITLQPGQSLKYGQFIAVGSSPAQAWGKVATLLHPLIGYISGRIFDSNFNPAPTAYIEVEIEDKIVMAYPDRDGIFNFMLPHRSYHLNIHDLGRKSMDEIAHVKAGATYGFDCIMNPPSKIDFLVKNQDGKPLPCTIEFQGMHETPNPNLSWYYEKGEGNRYHTKKGIFTLRMNPGTYKLIFTSKNYQSTEKIIQLNNRETRKVSVTLLPQK
ncbi:hypothetical protein GF373_02575 [bacterium]|nr:hypothetical protein [bacterium]